MENVKRELARFRKRMVATQRVFRKFYSGYMVSASKGLPQDEALAIQPYRLSSMMRFRPTF